LQRRSFLTTSEAAAPRPRPRRSPLAVALVALDAVRQIVADERFEAHAEPCSDSKDQSCLHLRLYEPMATADSSCIQLL
jgi:hypothetical protein